MIHVGMPIRLFCLVAVRMPFRALNQAMDHVWMHHQASRYAVAALRPANDDEKAA